ncbi:MAG TPA: hypothetical protein VFJ95_06365, partial [Gammaproteobacteria bacterium]|nr:hypothetical protein [Gammaproteobacteria bacterium]
MIIRCSGSARLAQPQRATNQAITRGRQIWHGLCNQRDSKAPASAAVAAQAAEAARSRRAPGEHAEMIADDAR